VALQLRWWIEDADSNLSDVKLSFSINKSKPPLHTTSEKNWEIQIKLSEIDPAQVQEVLDKQ